MIDFYNTGAGGRNYSTLRIGKRVSLEQEGIHFTTFDQVGDETDVFLNEEQVRHLNAKLVAWLMNLTTKKQSFFSAGEL